MPDPSSPLRILQISTRDVGGGGAERIAWNLFREYRARGLVSQLAVGTKQSDDPDVIRLPNDPPLGAWTDYWSRLAARLRSVEEEPACAGLLSESVSFLADPLRAMDRVRGVEDFHFPGIWRAMKLLNQPPSVVHGHNLHGDYFDLRALSWLSRQFPVLLTLHDSWLFTGHCAHSFDCERWQTGCGACPDLNSYPSIRRDATGYNWWRKRGIYRASRLAVATPSRWLMDRVEQSMLAPAIVDARVIPNGVDLSTFHPHDRAAARAELDLPGDALILLFVAVTPRRNIWKDFDTARRAVAIAGDQLVARRVVLLALGDDAPTERIGRVELRYLPFQNESNVVARCYQAADVYVHPARVDTFPNTVLEAMACGTPVVATDVGGISEQVEDGETGFLTPVGDAEALARRLVQLASADGLRQRLAAGAAETVRRRFDLQQQVDTYLNWYGELVTRHAAGGYLREAVP